MENKHLYFTHPIPGNKSGPIAFCLKSITYRHINLTWLFRCYFLHGKLFYWKREGGGRGGGISCMCTVSMRVTMQLWSLVCSCFSCATILACYMVEFVMITEQNGKNKRYNSSSFDHPNSKRVPIVTHFKIYCILHDFSHDQDEAADKTELCRKLFCKKILLPTGYTIDLFLLLFV